MSAQLPSDVVGDIAGLEAIYGTFPEGGRTKETPVITPLQRRWIAPATPSGWTYTTACCFRLCGMRPSTGGS
mgnify:CR=1 FL=1